jgi:hypothetical protein
LARRQRGAHQRGAAAGPTQPDRTAVVPVVGTYRYQLGYFPMTSPVNIAIYAFGIFMLFTFAIGFFGAPG